MIELFTLAALGAAFTLITADRTPPDPVTTPGLSSQRSQIKPVAASKHPYLGPKRPRSAEFYRNRRTKKAVRKLPF